MCVSWASSAVVGGPLALKQPLQSRQCLRVVHEITYTHVGGHRWFSALTVSLSAAIAAICD